MSDNQKRVMYAAIILIVLTLLFPPFTRVFPNGVARHIGYRFITNPPVYGTINAILLLIQWIGILLVSGLAFFIFKKKD